MGAVDPGVQGEFGSLGADVHVGVDQIIDSPFIWICAVTGLSL
jgi:hypothetical protein